MRKDKMERVKRKKRKRVKRKVKKLKKVLKMKRKIQLMYKETHNLAKKRGRRKIIEVKKMHNDDFTYIIAYKY